MIGKPFLKRVLGSYVKEICDNPSEGGASFEVDPSKLEPGENLQKNQQKLQATCSKFLRKIFDSLEDSPLEFRKISNSLQLQVAEKFPGSSQLCIGGFLFLRYFCPAIVTPVHSGLVTEQPTEKSQRGLTLVAKVLQNVSNNVTFGTKEESMDWLNSFMQSNFSACQDYFDAMAKVPSNAKATASSSVNDDQKEKAMMDLYGEIKKIYPKLDINNIKTTLRAMKRPLDKLTDLMAEMQKTERDYQEEKQRYDELMAAPTKARSGSTKKMLTRSSSSSINISRSSSSFINASL